MDQQQRSASDRAETGESGRESAWPILQSRIPVAGPPGTYATYAQNPNHMIRFEFDLVCFSHLRWNFVFQRPHHLLTRFAKQRNVYFVEEPVYSNSVPSHGVLSISPVPDGVQVVVPVLPEGTPAHEGEVLQKALIEDFFTSHNIHSYVLWYYTPMALAFSSGLRPMAVVYDCMDELSAFRGAPTNLQERERELFRRADVVFTGGQSLFECKRDHHRNIHPFPSSVDIAHFRRARRPVADPADQREIPRPRFGFFGVIDERFDRSLLEAVSEARPDWHFVMVGPLAKIDPADLPSGANIHYLGPKSYSELPAYLAGWDVATLLFERNEATRYISPTKTPEYLAAGRPVISTSIRDVVTPYGEMGLVKIADDPESFIHAGEEILQNNGSKDAWLGKVDWYLSSMSWEKTWTRMNSLVQDAVLNSLAAPDEETPSLSRMAVGRSALDRRTNED